MMKSFVFVLVLVLSTSPSFANTNDDTNTLINAAVRTALATASGKDPSQILDSTPLCQVGTFGESSIEQIDAVLEAAGKPDIDVSQLPIPVSMISLVSCTITVEQLIRVIENAARRGH